MSVAANDIGAMAARPSRLALFWDSSIGKKALMALTGLILSAYVAAHLLGNMQIYMGSEVIDRYAHFLHSNAGLLWSARVVLLAAFLTHAIAGIQLYMRKAQARPVEYHTKANLQASTASRTMLVSGVVIFAFVVYHVLDLTTGTLHMGTYEEVRPSVNVVSGFSNPLPAGLYVIAMIAVGFHLWHGLYSMFNSLGFSHPRYTPGLRKAAATVATVIALANISVPLAILAGFRP